MSKSRFKQKTSITLPPGILCTKAGPRWVCFAGHSSGDESNRLWDAESRLLCYLLAVTRMEDERVLFDDGSSNSHLSKPHHDQISRPLRRSRNGNRREVTSAATSLLPACLLGIYHQLTGIVSHDGTDWPG